MGKKTNRTSLLSRDSAMIAGVGKHLKGVTLTLLGKTFTDTQIVSALQAGIDAENAATAARTALAAAVQAALKQRSDSKDFDAALKQTVLAMFRNQPEVLSDFGLAPPKKRAKPTTEQNAVKAAKNRATRAARHTVGPVKKQAITGDVSSVEILPVTKSGGTNGSSTTQKLG